MVRTESRAVDRGRLAKSGIASAFRPRSDSASPSELSALPNWGWAAPQVRSTMPRARSRSGSASAGRPSVRRTEPRLSRVIADERALRALGALEDLGGSSRTPAAPPRARRRPDRSGRGCSATCRPRSSRAACRWAISTARSRNGARLGRVAAQRKTVPRVESVRRDVQVVRAETALADRQARARDADERARVSPCIRSSSPSSLRTAATASSSGGACRSRGVERSIEQRLGAVEEAEVAIDGAEDHQELRLYQRAARRGRARSAARPGRGSRVRSASPRGCAPDRRSGRARRESPPRSARSRPRQSRGRVRCASAPRRRAIVRHQESERQRRSPRARRDGARRTSPRDRRGCRAARRPGRPSRCRRRSSAKASTVA